MLAENLVVLRVHLELGHAMRTLIENLMQSLGTLLVADLNVILTLPSEIVIIKKIFNLLADFLCARLFQLLGRICKNHISLNRMHPALSVIAPERVIDMMSSAGERYNGHALMLDELSDSIGNNLGNSAK